MFYGQYWTMITWHGTGVNGVETTKKSAVDDVRVA